MKSLECPRSLRVVVGLLSALLVAAVLVSLLREEAITILTIIESMCVIIICAASNYALSAIKLTLDEQQMTYCTLTGSTIYKWEDIDDVDQTPHFTFVSMASSSRRLTLCSGEYGLSSLQPFEELRREITNKVLSRLYERWDRLNLPLTFTYPRFHWTVILAYTIPLFLVFMFFALFVVPTEGMVVEKVVFIVLGVIIVLPFFIRDFRRSRKKLVLEQQGLRQTNGKQLVIPWHEIKNISVKESYIGYGSISVGSNETGWIRIPGSHPNRGQILHLIKKHTNLTESYGHE